MDLTAKRYARRDWLIERAGGACQLCGYGFIGINGHHFDWHHKDRSTKEFNFGSGMTRNLDALEREADKCLLLCKLCHADQHFARDMNKVVPRINLMGRT
jgi:hypothetical protein